MKSWQRAMLMPFAAGGIIYILLDRFTTDAAAPLTTPRTCEPGPGQLTIVDTNSIVSVSSAQLVLNGTPAANDRITSASQARLCGRAFLFSVPSRTTITNGQCNFSFGPTVTSTSIDAGFEYVSTTAIRWKSGVTVIEPTYTLGAGVHDFAIIMRGTGAWLYGRNGGTGVYTLLWVYNAATAAEFARLILTGAFATAITMDDFRITDIGGQYATDYGIATDRVASPSSGATATMTSDAVVEFTWTVATNETLELDVRRTDASNRWCIRCSQSGSTIKVIEINAGSETERSSTAQTWTNTTAYRIVVTADGTTIKPYVDLVPKTAYASASFNATATGVAVAGFATGSNLVAWGRFAALPFDKQSLVGFLPYGDSKTQGAGDDTPPALGANGYPPLLAGILSGTTESPLRIARSGANIATMRANVTADLLNTEGLTPNWILCNVGANDVVAMPTQAAFEADYGAVIDAMHTKWPNALIGVMRIWRQTYDANSDTLATWIGNVVSARSYCFLGPDERVFLKGNDDGATYTADGLHPNHAGYILTAQQWKSRIAG